jgi:hypothetical protein
LIQAQSLVADTTLSACQPTTGHDRVEGRSELVTGIQNVGRNINYGKTRTLARFDTSAIPQNATVTDAQLGLWRVQDNGNSTSMTVHPLTRGGGPGRGSPRLSGFLFRRLAEMAVEDSSLRDRQPWKAVIEKDYGWFGGAITKHYEGTTAT